MITVTDVLKARRRIAPFIRPTPLVRSAWLSDASGRDVYLKLESQQITGSFKARGAFAATLARLDRAAGAPIRFVTASAGNHGRALACAGEALGVPVTVFTAKGAPRTKLDAIRRHHADLRAVGETYDDAETLAREFPREKGLEFVSAYSDPDILAGTGTIALEILADLPTVDEIVVPIGGGGLIGGIAATVRSIQESVRVVGVEAAASTPFTASLNAGRLTKVDVRDTVADGLAGNLDPDTLTFDYVRKFVDHVAIATEDDLYRAVTGLVRHEHQIAEGAGAAGVAAVLNGQAGRGRAVAVVVSGSNIDLETLMGVLTATGHAEVSR